MVFKTRDLTLLLLAALISSFSLRAQSLSSEQYEELSLKYTRASIPELVEFLSIPNNALIDGHVEDNLAFLHRAFKKRNFETRELPSSSRTAFFGERMVDKSLPTVLFYMHFDGQPIDPTKWNQSDPYKPVIKKPNGDGSYSEVNSSVLDAQQFADDLRIFARSASDDKGPIIMFLAALDALSESKAKPAFNMKIILDPEEEQGSKSMPEAIENYDDLLKADHMVIFDGPVHDSNLPTLTFGCRGIAGFELTVFGPRTPQHSGHFGNYAPNPALRLAQLLSSMKDDDGKVVIPGFYDGINLTPEIREILAAVPDNLEQIHKRVGITDPDKVGANYQEAMQYPSLNIRGMSSGWVGDEARTIVPDKAVATIDIRLVPETDGFRLLRLVRKHIQDQGYYIIEKRDPTEDERKTYGKIARFDFDPNEIWKAFNTPIDSKTGVWLYNSLKNVHQQEVARIRLAGGSVPIAFFVNGLEIPAVLVPLVNPDNNQHSPNENLRLGHYRNGIKTILGVLTSSIE